MSNNQTSREVVKRDGNGNIKAVEITKSIVLPAADGKTSVIRTTRTRVVKIIRKLVRKP